MWSQSHWSQMVALWSGFMGEFVRHIVLVRLDESPSILS